MKLRRVLRLRLLTFGVILLFAHSLLGYCDSPNEVICHALNVRGNDILSSLVQVEIRELGGQQIKALVVKGYLPTVWADFLISRHFIFIF